MRGVELDVLKGRLLKRSLTSNNGAEVIFQTWSPTATKAAVCSQTHGGFVNKISFEGKESERGVPNSRNSRGNYGDPSRATDRKADNEPRAVITEGPLKKN